mgnify:CR=1 FL=1
MSITYHKKTKKRKTTHGFRKRMATNSGKQILKKRRKKQKARLTP